MKSSDKFTRDLRRNPKMVWIILSAILIVSIFLTLCIGRYYVSIDRVAGIFLSWIFPTNPFWTANDHRVVTLIRAPRVLLSVIAGMGLATSGAALQGVFRNPLVGPQIIGISSGSGFGGALAILLFNDPFLTMGLAFAFGMISMILVYFISRTGGRSPVLMLVLAGLIVSTFFTALISLLKYVADPYSKLPAIVVWLMGSFATATYTQLLTVSVPIIGATAFLFALRFRINVVSLGDEQAEALGIHVDRTRWLILMAVTVVTSSIVSASGIVGWIGLVVPHIARMFLGPDHRKLIPGSALLGGVYTLWIDTIARTSFSTEIPIGIITALVGAPLFGYLLKTTQAKGWKHD